MTQIKKIFPWLCCLVVLLIGTVTFFYQQQSCFKKLTTNETLIETVYNCQKSGGSFTEPENICVCPVEYGETLQYDLITKQCLGSDGTPGGELGKQIREGLQNKITEDASKTTEDQNQTDFSNLLLKKENYSLPFGAAEIEAYYTTVEKPTSLDGSTPKKTCAALVITDGPETLMNSLTVEQFGNPPTIVLGSVDSVWNGISESTKNSPVKILVTMNPTFEGELIGCMSWPFNSWTVIE